MDSQGQLSVEYLLLLVVIFAVFGGMITYLIGPSIDAGNDISDVSAASNSVNSIANAVNVVYANGPGSTRTVNYYVPYDNLVLSRGGNYINMTVTLSDGTNKTVSGVTNYVVANNPGTGMSEGWHSVKISWNSASTVIRVDRLT